MISGLLFKAFSGEFAESLKKYHALADFFGIVHGCLHLIS